MKITTEVEDELANEAIGLLKLISNEFGQEEFGINDIPSFGHGNRYNRNHFKYLLDNSYITKIETGVFTVTEHAMAVLS